MSDDHDYTPPDYHVDYQVSMAADDLTHQQLAASANDELASARAAVQQRMTGAPETGVSVAPIQAIATDVAPEGQGATAPATPATPAAAARPDLPPETPAQPPEQTVATTAEPPVEEPTTREPAAEPRTEARDDETRQEATREDTRRPDEAADDTRATEARRDVERAEAELPEPEVPERTQPEAETADPTAHELDPARDQGDRLEPEHPQAQTTQPSPDAHASDPRGAEAPAVPVAAPAAERERAEEQTVQRAAEKQAQQDAVEPVAETHVVEPGPEAVPSEPKPEAEPAPVAAVAAEPQHEREAERERAEEQTVQRAAEQHVQQDAVEPVAETHVTEPEHTEPKAETEPAASAPVVAERHEREAERERAEEQAAQRAAEQQAQHDAAQHAAEAHVSEPEPEPAEPVATPAPPVDSHEQRILDAALAPDPSPVSTAERVERATPPPPAPVPVPAADEAARLAHEQQTRESLVADQAAEQRAEEQAARVADEQQATQREAEQAHARAAVTEAMEHDVAAKEAPDTRERGEFGHVTAMRKQPRAEYEDGHRSTENEHVLPGAQLRAITYNPLTDESDYTARHYRNSDTVRVERDFALEKTSGAESSDNTRSEDIKERLAAGERVDLNADILSPSLDEARRARDVTDSEVGDRALNTAAVGQAGDLFGIQRLSDDDPTKSTAAKVRAFDEALNGPATEPQAPYVADQDDWSDFDDAAPPKTP